MMRKAFIWTPANQAYRKGSWIFSRFSKAEQHPSNLGLTALLHYLEDMQRRRETYEALFFRSGKAFALRPVKPAVGKEGDS